MDKSSCAHFRKVLSDRRDELQNRLNAARREKMGSGLAEAKDEGDRATASTSAEVSGAQLAQTESLLKVINAALRRIEEGTFGECLNCGQEIGAKRLEAIPWTRYCLTCQELVEGS
jgi:DnaK suppressor protein